MKNSARYGVTTGALVLAGICLARISNGAEFGLVVLMLPPLFGAIAGFVAHSGEGS